MSKILIVDDDPVIRKLAENLVKRQGHKVLTAENGVDGFTKFKNFKPDVVISDVLMPEMDGYEFCAKIRSIPEGRQVPILLMTSLDSVEQKIMGFDAGADDYIIKPFDPREFNARLGILVKRSELVKAAAGPKKTGGKNIAVFSFRGGSGVSTIAANVAVGLAQIWQQPTTLVDMVMMGGQSVLYFNLPFKNTWSDIVKFPEQEIDYELIQSVLVPHDSGVSVLASPRHPELAELVSPEKVTRVLTELKEVSEYVIMDLPHDLTPTTLAALDCADVILLVLPPEIVAIRSAVMALRLFNNLEYDLDRVHILVNWTFPRNGFSNTDIEKSLKKKITMMFPYAPDQIIEGINLGIPPTFSDPTEPLGVIFEDLALALSKKEHLKITPANPSPSWLRALDRYQKRKTPK